MRKTVPTRVYAFTLGVSQSADRAKYTPALWQRSAFSARGSNFESPARHPPLLHDCKHGERRQSTLPPTTTILIKAGDSDLSTKSVEALVGSGILELKKDPACEIMTVAARSE